MRHRLSRAMPCIRSCRRPRTWRMRMCRSSSPGPNGAGKEVLANIVQANSSVRDKPFLKVNLGALPNDLIEAELFGTEAGAFTGAKARIGRVRSGGRRHAVSRRDGEYLRHRPGEAASRAADRVSSSGSARASPARRGCASLRRPTPTCGRRSAKANSARTCSTG